MIKIWGRPNSICTQRVLWTCAEAELAFELTLASATMGPDGHVSAGNRPFGIVDSEAYRALNPNATVPTIDDDGFILWESNAIVSYLAQKYAAEALFGGCLETLARAQQWMAWTNEHLEPALHILVMELVRRAEAARDPGAAEAARRDILPRLHILDAHLGPQDYLAGASFTLADIPAGAAVHRWLLFDLERPAMANLQAWQDRLAARVGFQRHIQPRENHLS